jgi:hypothetical protein
MKKKESFFFLLLITKHTHMGANESSPPTVSFVNNNAHTIIGSSEIIEKSNQPEKIQSIETDEVAKPLFEFEKAIQHSVAYLQSNEFKNREDVHDSIDSIPSLVNMNRLGFLTVASQPGIATKGKNHQTGKQYAIKQRAYVNGFMKQKDAEEFVELFNTDLHNDKVCLVYTIVDDEKSIVSGAFQSRPLRLPLTIDTGKVVTRDDFTIPKTNVKNIAQEVGLLISDEDWDDLVLLTCFDSKWNRHALNHSGLHQHIIKTLRHLSRNQKK